MLSRFVIAFFQGVSVFLFHLRDCRSIKDAQSYLLLWPLFFLFSFKLYSFLGFALSSLFSFWVLIFVASLAAEHGILAHRFQ